MRDYRHILNKVLPYHTDDSMSLYEFVGRLYEYIKNFEGTLDEAHEKIDEFTTYITSDIEEFKTSTTGEIADFIDRFDVQLDETTAQILTEWKNDGTLEQIINLVWEGKADKVYVDNLINETANVLDTKITENKTNIGLFYPVKTLPPDTDLHTVDTGNYRLGGSYINGIPDVMFGLLMIIRYGDYISLIFHSVAANTIWFKTRTNTSWRDWVKIDGSEIAQEIARVESDLDTKITGVETVANAVYFHYISDSVLEYARTITDTNFKVIRCSTPTDVPSDYQYSNGFVLRKGEDGINVVLFSYTDPTKMVSNVYYGSEWSGWKEIGGSGTAIDILDKIKDVDGSGSGLDADTLDGYHGDSYIRSGLYSNRLGRNPIVEGSADIGGSFLQFYNNGSTRQGFIGLGSEGRSDLSVRNDLEGGRVLLRDKANGGTYNDRLLATVTYGTGDAPANLARGEIYVKY